MKQDEDFLDVGAFNGDTIEKFLNTTNKTFSSIYALEMSKKNFKELKIYIETKYGSVKHKIEMINCGAWDEKTITTCGDESDHSGISCSINKGKRSFLSSEEIEDVQLDMIDNILKDRKISFIKMDIEGAEVKAIKGAKECIRINSPKMAICIYHNLSDYWEVPLAIKNTNPNYNIAVRHHSNDNSGTVCYAWI